MSRGRPGQGKSPQTARKIHKNRAVRRSGETFLRESAPCCQIFSFFLLSFFPCCHSGSVERETGSSAQPGTGEDVRKPTVTERVILSLC